MELDQFLEEFNDAHARRDAAQQIQLIARLSTAVATRKQLRNEWQAASSLPGPAMPTPRAVETPFFAPQSPIHRQSTNWKERADNLRLRAQTERWTRIDFAAAAIWLGERCSEDDQEEVGIELNDIALEQCGGVGPEIRRALLIKSAMLQLNLAITFEKAGKLSAAFSANLRASQGFVRLDMPERACQAFDRGESVFGRLRPAYEIGLLAAVASATPLLENVLKARALNLRRIWRNLLADIAFREDGVDPLILMQLSKAASLTCWRMAHIGLEVLHTGPVRIAHEHWQSISSDVSPEGVLPEYEYGSDLEGLLTAYDDTSERRGATKQEQVFNLQRRFDQALTAELSKREVALATCLLGFDEIRAALTDRTVIASILPCPTVDGRLRTVTLIITKEGCELIRTDGAGAWWNVQIGNVRTDSIAGAVAEFRRQLQLGPLFDEGCPARAWLSELVFGPMRSTLSRLHASGYDHLCINPFGALHYCPFAVLRFADESVSKDWTVTHLPALTLLRPRKQDGFTGERSGGAALGVTFDGPTRGLHGLGPLGFVRSEVEAVATAMGSVPLLDEAATASAFVDAVSKKRYVHLATHGRQDPAAPSFQVLYLSLGPSHGGVYRAFEILAHDLDGLELVTLSACETSLGRIDLGDNARGLQAYLFVAGARAVVSCLWPVHDDVARFFFAGLHAELANGLDKLSAFRQALAATKLCFPQPEDWGAFQFSGAW